MKAFVTILPLEGTICMMENALSCWITTSRFTNFLFLLCCTRSAYTLNLLRYCRLTRFKSPSSAFVGDFHGAGYHCRVVTKIWRVLGFLGRGNYYLCSLPVFLESLLCFEAFQTGGWLEESKWRVLFCFCFFEYIEDIYAHAPTPCWPISIFTFFS